VEQEEARLRALRLGLDTERREQEAREERDDLAPEEFRLANEKKCGGNWKPAARAKLKTARAKRLAEIAPVDPRVALSTSERLHVEKMARSLEAKISASSSIDTCAEALYAVEGWARGDEFE
jgi:hypothetical protein